MSKHILVSALLTAAALAPTPAWVQDLTALKSVNVELPAGDQQFPGGSESDAINNNCLACHSADMVLNQPALPKATWEAEVHKMIDIYKAPIDNADVASIVAYLAKTKGMDSRGQ
jgi:cytochrome c553